ncbi:response regulator transcription factor [Ideonella sp. DXS22W]|uniref:Response regulator transcription factor n=1 Tax=Pseudaquabacterium inlustre TaxID=2984192 RepID=A0ABU9CEM6_9BURK
MIHVMLAIESAELRASFRRRISGAPDLRVLAEAESLDRACEPLRLQGVDVVLAALPLAGATTAAGLVGALRRQAPQARVLLLGGPASAAATGPCDASLALQAGAMGWMPHECEAGALLPAVRGVASGRRVFPPAVLRTWLDAGQPMTRGPLAGLTPREYEVLRMATDGLTVTSIGRALQLSHQAIHGTMSSVRRKLDAPSDFSLMRLVAEQRLYHG